MSYVDQLRRHVLDLATDSYEGRQARPARFELFIEAVRWLTPVVTQVLEEMSREILAGTGTVETGLPPHDGEGSHVYRWTLSWPLLRESKHRITGSTLDPVLIAAAFPPGYTHPHLGEDKPPSAAGIWAWPIQLASPEEAWSLRGIVEAIAVASIHERIFQADTGWRLVP